MKRTHRLSARSRWGASLFLSFALLFSAAVGIPFTPASSKESSRARAQEQNANDRRVAPLPPRTGPPANEDELNHKFIPITYSDKIDGGSIVTTSGGDLNEFANKVGFEFMSLEGFVSCVRQTVDATIEITERKVADSKRAASQ